MKALFPVAAALALMVSPARASWSKFLILDSGSYQGDHAEFRPTLKVNGRSPDFIDIRIPYVDNEFSYWLVVATESLPDERLNFRQIVWEGVIPPKIQSIARLGVTRHLFPREPKKGKFIEITIHKDLLGRSYVYHDFDVSMDDGGYYYTYDLSKHQVEQHVQNKGATPPDQRTQVTEKPEEKTRGIKGGQEK